MPLNANQEAVLQELDNTYTLYLAQEWPNSRADFRSTGAFLLDQCSKNFEIMKETLQVVRIALLTSSESISYKNARNICTMFSELVVRDATFRPNFKRSMQEMAFLCKDEILIDPEKLAQALIKYKPYNPDAYHRGNLLC